MLESRARYSEMANSFFYWQGRISVIFRWLWPFQIPCRPARAWYSVL